MACMTRLIVIGLSTHCVAEWGVARHVRVPTPLALPSSVAGLGGLVHAHPGRWPPCWPSRRGAPTRWFCGFRFAASHLFVFTKKEELDFLRVSIALLARCVHSVCRAAVSPQRAIRRQSEPIDAACTRDMHGWRRGWFPLVDPPPGHSREGRSEATLVPKQRSRRGTIGGLQPLADGDLGCKQHHEWVHAAA